VSKKPQEWGGHGPRWAAAPRKKIEIISDIVRDLSNYGTLIAESLLR